MKRMIFVFCIMFLFIGYAHGESGKVGCDGGLWKRLNRNVDPATRQLVKVILVRGIYEGAWAVNEAEARETFFIYARYSTIAYALDRFYSDDRNIKIPITQALIVVSMELKREDKTAIEDTLREMRSAAGQKSTAYMVTKDDTISR